MEKWKRNVINVGIGVMGEECRMAGVAVATLTLPVPHQHFVPGCIIAGHTNNTAV